MSDIKVEIVPQRSALLAGHDNELHALVRIQAPDAPEDLQATRRPLNLALVLDRSGSMDGRPMIEAQRCAEFIVDQLGPEDRLSLVAYDNDIDTLITSGPITDKAHAKRAIQSLYARGMTALFDGWRTGAEQALRVEAGDGCISRVLLLSDGCANVGLTEVGDITPYCAEMAGKGISTSTYGLGHHFNEELMVAMAQAGQGQSYYGEAAEDLMDPFQEEFALLSATCVRGLELSLKTAEGVKVKLLNDYPESNHQCWRLPDLAYDGEVWALAKLTVPKGLADGGDHTRLLSASLTFKADGELLDNLEAHLDLPSLQHASFGALAQDETVMARMQELRVAEIQRDIREAAMNGDWRNVEILIAQAEREADRNAWLRENLDAIKRYVRERDRMRASKEAMYSSRKLRSRMAAKAESVTDYLLDEEALKPNYLRRKTEQGKRF